MNDIQFSGLGLYDSDQPGDHALTGGEVVVKAVVQNRGGQGTDQPFFLRLTRTNLGGGLPVTSDLLDSPVLVEGGIGAGQQRVISLPRNTAWTQDGAYTITATIDSTESVVESNEFNNSLSEILTVREPAPDLRPFPATGRGLRLSNDRPVVGQELVLHGEVWNVGSANLLPGQTFKTTVTVAGQKEGTAYSMSFPAEGVIIENGIPIGTKAAFQVPLSGAETAAFGAGVNNITITADSLDQITEMREINNSVTYPVNFYSQPLWLREFTINPNQLVIPTSDNAVDLLVEIENVGVLNSGGSVSFYRGSVAPANFIGTSIVNPIAPLGGKGPSQFGWMNVPLVEGDTPVIAKLGDSELIRILRITSLPRPDVQIRSTDISISPVSPHRIGSQGEMVTVSAYIKNLSPTRAEGELLRR